MDQQLGFGLLCTSSRAPRHEPSMDELQAYSETMERLEATRTDYDNLETLEDDLLESYTKVMFSSVN